MSTFTPCRGKMACRDDGINCTTCNRSLSQIDETRRLIDGLAEFVCRQCYDNAEVFLSYVAEKTAKKVARHSLSPLASPGD